MKNLSQRFFTLLKATREDVKTLNAVSDEKSLGSESFPVMFRVLKSVDRLANLVYQMRGRPEVAAEARIAEDAFSTLSHEIVATGRVDLGDQIRESFSERYQKIWRQHFSLFLVVAIVFIAFFYLGWNIGQRHTSYVPLIIGYDWMETVIEHRSWFTKGAENPLYSALTIMTNNIKVCTLVYLAGMVGGLGGFAMMAYNGILFGCLFGFCMTQNFDDGIFEFVLAHGPLELTVIVASCFASLLVGKTFFEWRSETTIYERLRRASAQSATVVAGILPWLILAGILEGFVSPMEDFSPNAKITVGLIAAGLFWLWTLTPRSSLPKSLKSNGSLRTTVR